MIIRRENVTQNECLRVLASFEAPYNGKITNGIDAVLNEIDRVTSLGVPTNELLNLSEFINQSFIWTHTLDSFYFKSLYLFICGTKHKYNGTFNVSNFREVVNIFRAATLEYT